MKNKRKSGGKSGEKEKAAVRLGKEPVEGGWGKKTAEQKAAGRNEGIGPGGGKDLCKETFKWKGKTKSVS